MALLPGFQLAAIARERPIVDLEDAGLAAAAAAFVEVGRRWRDGKRVVLRQGLAHSPGFQSKTGSTSLFSCPRARS